MVWVRDKWMHSQHRLHQHATIRLEISAMHCRFLREHQMNTNQSFRVWSIQKMALNLVIHLPPLLWSMYRHANCIWNLVPIFAISQNKSWPPFPHNYAPLLNNRPSVSIGGDLLQQMDAAVWDVLSLAHELPTSWPKYIPMLMSVEKSTMHIGIHHWRFRSSSMCFIEISPNKPEWHLHPYCLL